MRYDLDVTEGSVRTKQGRFVNKRLAREYKKYLLLGLMVWRRHNDNRTTPKPQRKDTKLLSIVAERIWLRETTATFFLNDLCLR